MTSNEFISSVARPEFMKHHGCLFHNEWRRREYHLDLVEKTLKWSEPKTSVVKDSLSLVKCAPYIVIGRYTDRLRKVRPSPGPDFPPTFRDRMVAIGSGPNRKKHKILWMYFKTDRLLDEFVHNLMLVLPKPETPDNFLAQGEAPPPPYNPAWVRPNKGEITGGATQIPVTSGGIKPVIQVGRRFKLTRKFRKDRGWGYQGCGYGYGHGYGLLFNCPRCYGPYCCGMQCMEDWDNDGISHFRIVNENEDENICEGNNPDQIEDANENGAGGVDSDGFESWGDWNWGKEEEGAWDYGEFCDGAGSDGGVIHGGADSYGGGGGDYGAASGGGGYSSSGGGDYGDYCDYSGGGDHSSGGGGGGGDSSGGGWFSGGDSGGGGGGGWFSGGDSGGDCGGGGGGDCGGGGGGD